MCLETLNNIIGITLFIFGFQNITYNLRETIILLNHNEQ